MAKYLRAIKNKGRSYWWLVESYRETGRIVQKKLKYWGVYKPSEKYRDRLMPLDNNWPSDDLWLVWQTETKAWRAKKMFDFTYWIKRGHEQWYWNDFSYKTKNLNNGIIGKWLTRAPKRSEAIKNVKQPKQLSSKALEVLRRMNSNVYDRCVVRIR